jgi:hypothetical protein
MLARVLILILSRKKSVHIIQTYYFKIKLNMILLFTPRSSAGALPFSILITILYEFLSSCMLYFHSSHSLSFYHHNSIMFAQEYELCSSSLLVLKVQIFFSHC